MDLIFIEAVLKTEKCAVCHRKHWKATHQVATFVRLEEEVKDGGTF